MAGMTPAVLSIRVLPQGAKVIVDGVGSGTTPVSLELPPGQHRVRVELDGYEPWTATIDLGTDGTTIEGQLAPLASGPTATFTPSPVPESEAEEAWPDLGIKYARITLETGDRCDYESTQLGVRVGIENTGDADAGPFVVEVNGVQQTVETGLEVGETTSLWFSGYSDQNTIIVDATSQIKEKDRDNNVFSERLPIPTLPPPCTRPPVEPPTNTPEPPPPPTDTPSPPPPTSTPTPPARPPAAVTVQKGQVSILTYPYADFVTEGWNETYNLSYPVLDRSGYEASNPTPVNRTYRTVELENEYLKLTLLPDLGGRIYQVFYKPTGHHETYRNPVLKPSPWGPPEQEWWLAAGGFEWCLPVIEHGYEWGIPWMVEVTQDESGATVFLRDTTATDRVRAEIAVRLEAGDSSFSIRPRLENPTAAAVTMSYWTNAALAPGGRNAPSSELRFVLPETVTEVTVHSRGDDILPDYNRRLPWPIYNDTDLSRLGNWNRWLGFFEDPAAGEFIAVYDEGYDEGLVRVFDPDSTSGAKVFALGWNDPIPSHNWTDDGSSYVELHGGPAPTFDDNSTIPAGGHLQWTEIWYPVAGLGSLRFATRWAALNLATGSGHVQIAAATTRRWSGDAVLLVDGQETWRQAVAMVPGQALVETISLDVGDANTKQVSLRLEGPDGSTIAHYETDAAFQ